MVLMPVPSPTSQLVGCVMVKDAIQVCGVGLMPAEAQQWSAGGNTVRNAQHGLSCLTRRHLDLRFVDAHALSRLHTMLLKFVADLPFSSVPIKPATGHACGVISHRCHRQPYPKAAALMHWLTSKFKSLPKVNIESLPTHGLVPLHARGGNNELDQIPQF